MSNKFPKADSAIYGFFGFIALCFVEYALFTHDWFYLAVAYLLGGNLLRVVNYYGDERDSD